MDGIYSNGEAFAHIMGDILTREIKNIGNE